MSNRLRLVNTLSFLVILTSVLVLLGWLLNIEFLKSVVPQFVTMKFTTAISFLFSGIILLALVHYLKGNLEIAEISLALFSTLLLFLVGSMFVASLVGVSTGIEQLVIKETEPSWTVEPGRPSTGTLIAFIIIGFVGILTVLKLPIVQTAYLFSGVALMTIGGLALLGYLLNMPALYYYLTDISTAMAIHTSTLFVLIGIGLLSLHKGREEVLINET